MSDEANPRKQGPMFRGAKVSHPVPVACRLIHEVLVQASLDPLIMKIEPVGSTRVKGVEVVLDGLIFTLSNGPHLIEIAEFADAQDFNGKAMRLLAANAMHLPVLSVTPADIRREPHARNCRLVWSCRGISVRPGDRVRVLEFLADEGTVPLGRLAPELRFTRDPVGALCAMACENLVEMELREHPLAPETRIRRRQ